MTKGTSGDRKKDHSVCMGGNISQATSTVFPVPWFVEQ